ncbi:hypothetical protein BZA05DRAFT_49633 [Tricharina praecox]|uniref:uncharacterized protein n=1 Tax=Tricharina praecox TaxID=43433 RepID=UPI00221FC558|nr:uncharacterized protein BZA05DRAFT_49633 [Tricharina praecox]KAI5852011.1 hypothetical protein BZA05DRAFT_49633 [Tricharina praecox]
MSPLNSLNYDFAPPNDSHREFWQHSLAIGHEQFKTTVAFQHYGRDGGVWYRPSVPTVPTTHNRADSLEMLMKGYHIGQADAHNQALYPRQLGIGNQPGFLQALPFSSMECPSGVDPPVGSRLQYEVYDGSTNGAHSAHSSSLASSHHLPIACHEAQVDSQARATGFDPPTNSQNRVGKRPNGKCQLCGRSVRLMNRHLRDRHGSTLEPRAATFDCTISGCKRRGDQSFTRKDNLTQHLRNVHGVAIPKRFRKEFTGGVVQS